MRHKNTQLSLNTQTNRHNTFQKSAANTENNNSLKDSKVLNTAWTCLLWLVHDWWGSSHFTILSLFVSSLLRPRAWVRNRSQCAILKDVSFLKRMLRTKERGGSPEDLRVKMHRCILCLKVLFGTCDTKDMWLTAGIYKPWPGVGLCNCIFFVFISCSSYLRWSDVPSNFLPLTVCIKPCKMLFWPHPLMTFHFNMIWIKSK